MTIERDHGGLAALAVLGDPVRRRVYLDAASRSGDVTREEVARAVGISRGLAAFHLDKLVEAGLLVASFRKRSGRAGRPPKGYRRAPEGLEVRIPERRYEVAAGAAFRALEARDGDRLREEGRRLGAQIGARARARMRTHRSGAMPALQAILAREGYRPEREDGRLRLRNCPFEGLVEEHRDLVCGMNLAMIADAVEALGAPRIRAVLEPRPGECCVRIDGHAAPGGTGLPTL